MKKRSGVDEAVTAASTVMGVVCFGLMATAQGAWAVETAPSAGVQELGLAFTTCNDTTWVGTPGMQDGGFVGTLEDTCSVRLPRDGSLGSLDQYLLSTVAQSKKVHEGPVEETYETLPSVRYDVTVEIPGDLPLTVREDVHVATDRATRLVFATFSKRVQGSGMAAYVQKLDVLADVRRGGTPGGYDIRLLSTLTVEKPWYAPDDVFINEVKKTALSQFNNTRDTTLSDMESHL